MNRYVIQEHQARSHHYDFRLEIDGELKSWSIPKGPSMSYKEHRLAIPVSSDHLKFTSSETSKPESSIPQGVAVIWDEGVYEPLGGKQMKQQLLEGKIAVKLQGSQLQGVFFLRKLPARKGQWLLTKFKDHYAQPQWKIKSLLKNDQKK